MNIDKLKKRRISPNDGAQYFFGYYDLQPYDSTMTRHLCHRVSFIDRLPTASDTAELGYIDLSSGEFVKLCESHAWNFQQGAMLQWNPACEDEIIYNDLVEDELRGVILNIASGKKHLLERPVANVSPDGRYGLSINFRRVYDFRPGYGYPGEDPYYSIGSPDKDGVFLVDMRTGRSRLIIDYARIQEEFGVSGYSDAKFVVNHITFNTASDSFLFLLRNFPENGRGWKTSLFTSDLNGNLIRLLSFTMVSHYHWKNERQILAYADAGEGNGLYLIDALTGSYEKYPVPSEWGDIHCIYDPSRRVIIGDGYPEKDGKRSLRCFTAEDGECGTLISVASVKPQIIDIRCDLHARWSRDGRLISYDSTETGLREVYELDVSEVF